MREAGEISPGELVLAVGFGAGLTYAGQVFACP
jgi:3-oxoacyl-[acyl-carrier-protein] synthase-3